jgi:hypothetical protein
VALSTINQTNKQTELYATSYSQDITFVIPKEEYPFMTLHVFFFILFIVLLFILFFSPYYWSDMFTVLLNMSTSMQICDDWNKNDTTIQTMHHDNVTSCPCSLDVALLDLTRFHIDPLCVETAVNVYDCYQQPFAKLCFKQNLPS